MSFILEDDWKKDKDIIPGLETAQLKRGECGECRGHYDCDGDSICLITLKMASLKTTALLHVTLCNLLNMVNAKIIFCSVIMDGKAKTVLLLCHVLNCV